MDWPDLSSPLCTESFDGGLLSEKADWRNKGLPEDVQKSWLKLHHTIYTYTTSKPQSYTMTASYVNAERLQALIHKAQCSFIALESMFGILITSTSWQQKNWQQSTMRQLFSVQNLHLKV